MCTIFAKSFQSETMTKIEKITEMTTTRIIVPFGVSKKIGKLLKVSQPWVRKALRGERSTALAMRIRETALSMGGKEYYSDKQ